MNTYEFINAAEWLSAQGLQIFPMLQTNEELTEEELSALSRFQAGILTGNAAVINSCKELDTRYVFMSADAENGALRLSHDKCRYLAENPEEISKLDMLSAPLLRQGYLENIAIRVSLSGNGAFTAENIQSFARLIRRSMNLAVRAIFLPLDLSGDLSQQVKTAFSLVKKIRSDLPCVLHSFCLEGILEPLSRGDAELLHTLKMIASLNDTSLYAKFFIS